MSEITPEELAAMRKASAPIPPGASFAAINAATEVKFRLGYEVPRLLDEIERLQKALAAAAKSSPLPTAADPSPAADLLLVVVNLKGGLVDKVKMPPGVRVIVRDYDVEGADEDDIVEDEDGNECIETERFADGSMR